MLLGASSQVTCSQHVPNVPEELWEAIESAGKAQTEHLYSEKTWPIDGGVLLNRRPVAEVEKPKVRELLLTGHEDGTVRFWNASDVALTPLYKYNSSILFTGEHLDVLEQPPEDEEDEWPPFRKVRYYFRLIVPLLRSLEREKLQGVYCPSGPSINSANYSRLFTAGRHLRPLLGRSPTGREEGTAVPAVGEPRDRRHSRSRNHGEDLERGDEQGDQGHENERGERPGRLRLEGPRPPARPYRQHLLRRWLPAPLPPAAVPSRGGHRPGDAQRVGTPGRGHGSRPRRLRLREDQGRERQVHPQSER
jgi:hypothetical protein